MGCIADKHSSCNTKDYHVATLCQSMRQITVLRGNRWTVQKPGRSGLYVIHVTRNSTMLVFPWRFHLEQLIKEMEVRAPDLLDAMATVTVPVA